MNHPAVECRVPTCRRPELLRRALLSLQRQSWTDWCAVVLDDSSASEGRGVVSSIADSRITYRVNPEPLGAAANLDQAFSPQPLLGGRHAFVLEDDNAVEAQFVTTALQRLARGDADILSFNQRCVHLTADGRETAGDVLRPATHEEIWDRDRLLLNAFLGLSLPNGGYFWRLGADIDLTVGSGTVEPQLQECARQTCVRPPVVLMRQPLSLWSSVPTSQVRRQVIDHRRFAVSLNQLSTSIAAQISPERLMERAASSGNAELRARLLRTLSDLSLISPACRAWFGARPFAALRCKLRFHLYRHPSGGPLAAAANRPCLEKSSAG